MGPRLLLWVILFTVLDRLGVYAYEVCEYISIATFTYCDNGKYCCHNNKDCCSYGNSGLVVGLVLGSCAIAAAIIIYFVLRRRRLRFVAATQARGQPHVIQTVTSVSSGNILYAPSALMAPPSYGEAVANHPTPNYK